MCILLKISKAQERHQIDIDWTPSLLEKISEGYNASYGARSIKNEVYHRIVSQLARAHELDVVQSRDKVEFYTQDEDIKLRVLKGGNAQNSSSSKGNKNWVLFNWSSVDKKKSEASTPDSISS